MKQNQIISVFKKRLIYLIILNCVAFLLSGCISATRSLGIDLSSNKKQDRYFAQGKYEEAAKLATTDKDKDAKIDNDNLLPTLKAGNAYLFAKKYEESTLFLNEAEAIIKYQRDAIMLGDIADYTTKLMLNDAALEFHATMTDSIMLNTYKALALMFERRFSDTRVELNRAIDRQRRAKEVYAKLIKKQQQLIQDKEKNKKNESGFATQFKKTLENPNTKKRIDTYYSNLKSFKAYPDFINPFTVYLAGLYFGINGDYKKSVDLLKEASAMMPKNKIVSSDFRRIDAALSGRRVKNKYVWIFFENGLAPIKKEYKVNIPVFLLSSKVKYVGIALPVFQQRRMALPYLSVTTKREKNVHSQLIADMDRVILTEFKYEYNDIVTRAILSAALKTFSQYEAGRYGGGYVAMATGLFSALTTHADTRTWTTLPKNFQVARVLMPKNHLVDLKLGSIHKKVYLAKNAKNSIVYVRMATASSAPSISVVNF